jgi:hypothetical protein
MKIDEGEGRVKDSPAFFYLPLAYRFLQRIPLLGKTVVSAMLPNLSNSGLSEIDNPYRTLKRLSRRSG